MPFLERFPHQYLETLSSCDMSQRLWRTFYLKDQKNWWTSSRYEAASSCFCICSWYFTEKLGATAVKWVNEETETGLPYDLIIEEEGNTEFIEVKTTTSTSKDWFPISTREWHCAAKKGDSFSIARVFLSGPTNPEIVILKNPWKLCQQRVLHLALLMPCSTEN